MRRILLWIEKHPVESVAALFLVAFVPAIVGAVQHLHAANEPALPQDVAYLVLQTSTLQLDVLPTQPDYSVALEWARFAAPIALGVATLAVLLVLFRRIADLAVAKLSDDHVVVCGLGVTGTEVVRKLGGHRQVVAIEVDDSQPGVAAARDAGVPVIVGDGREPEVLHRAGLHRAELLVITCGDDRLAGEVLAGAAAVAADGAQSFQVQLQLDDPDLADALQREQGTLVLADVAAGAGSVPVDPFSLDEVAAARLIQRHADLPVARDLAPPIVVVGDGALGRAFVVQVARRWGAEPRAGRLRLRWAGSSVGDALGEVQARLTDLDEVLEVELFEGTPRRPEVVTQLVRGAPRAFVLLDDEASGLTVALRIEHVADELCEVIVRTEREEGLGSVLASEHLVPFSVVGVACEQREVFGGFWWRLARLSHEDHRLLKRQQIEQGLVDGDVGDRALVPWEELDDDLVESNLAQVRDLPRRAEGLGLQLVRLHGARPEGDLGIKAEALEGLSEQEHDRWCEHKRAQGWSTAPRGEAKDEARRVHPDLVPYAELDEATRELDRNVIRRIPAQLAAVGMQLVPVPADATDRGAATAGADG